MLAQNHGDTGMATVNIVFAKVGVRGIENSYPAYLSGGIVSEDITSSASSQATTATALEGQTARITASGGNIRVIAGASPTALTSSLLVLDGTSFDLGVETGDKIAVIDG